MVGTVAVMVGNRERRESRLIGQPERSPGRPRVIGENGPPRNTSIGERPIVDQPRPLPPPHEPKVGDEAPPTAAPLPSLAAALPPTDSPPPRPTDAPSPAEAPVIARITGSKAAVWYAGPPARNELTAGDLRLTQGSVQITMARGAVVTLTAPAELELRTPQLVFLRRGDLTATVPTQAVGFEVQSPCSRVVDLGTEFDVTVDDGGATSVRVLRGTVELTTTPAGIDGDRWQLDAGQFKWVSSDARRHLDYRLALAKAEKPPGGTLTINGERIAFSRPDEFALAWVRLGQELVKLRGLAPPRADGSFQGEIDLPGKRIPIRSAADTLRANQDVVGLFGQLWSDAIRSGGGEFRIDTLNDLLKSQNEMFNRFFDGVGPKPDAQPKPAAGEKGERGEKNEKSKPRPKRAESRQWQPGQFVHGGELFTAPETVNPGEVLVLELEEAKK
jgi:hypothetical protein